MPKIMNEQEVYTRSVGFDMRMSYDANGRQQYIGFAFPGAADSSLVWQIYRLAYDANGRMTHRRYSDGTDDFTKSWTLRGDYSYVE